MDAAIYVRISLDQQGEGLGVARQEQDCRALIARNDWNVHDVYTDNDISAYSGKLRPAYQRMLADIRDGKVQAIVVWHPDRLHRSTRELETFIDLVEEHKCKVATCQAGEIDLATPTGRMSARIVGAVARHESELKGARQKRAFQQARETGGILIGSRPYGYEDDKMTICEAEAEVIREATARILAGDPPHRVAVDFNRQGIPTARGRRWSSMNLWTILANARISGRVQEFYGPDGNRRSGLRVGRIIGEAKWPAIISPGDSDRLREMATHPKQRGRPAAYLLTGGIAICGLCGTALSSHTTGRTTDLKRYLYCLKNDGKMGDSACGRLAIQNARVEANVTEAVLRRVEGGALINLLNAPDADALEELVRVEQDLAMLAGDWGSGRIDRAEYDAAKGPLKMRQKDLQRRLQATRANNGLEGLPDPLRPIWPDLTLLQKRAVIRALVEAVVINPPKSRGCKFDSGRIEIRWRA